MDNELSRDDWVRLSRSFSPRVMRALTRSDPAAGARELADLADLVRDLPDATLGDAFEAAHRKLVRHYPSEYTFKSQLVSKLVFGRHSPRTASVLLEQPMGTSYADVMVLNGTTTVYEIKTDLDQFTRLSTQLADYSSRAERVYVVVSDKRASAAEAFLPPHVGLMALRKTGSFTEIRSAESNFPRMRHEHMIHMLHTAEARAVTSRIGGSIPEVHPGQLWSAMREVFAATDIQTAHAEVLRELRGRSSSILPLVNHPDFPKSLRALAYTAPHSSVGTARAQNRLGSRASLFLGVAG